MFRYLVHPYHVRLSSASYTRHVRTSLVPVLQRNQGGTGPTVITLSGRLQRNHQRSGIPISLRQQINTWSTIMRSSTRRVNFNIHVRQPRRRTCSSFNIFHVARADPRSRTPCSTPAKAVVTARFRKFSHNFLRAQDLEHSTYAEVRFMGIKRVTIL